jgi:hypothetical protein
LTSAAEICYTERQTLPKTVAVSHHLIRYRGNHILSVFAAWQRFFVATSDIDNVVEKYQSKKNIGETLLHCMTIVAVD